MSKDFHTGTDFARAVAAHLGLQGHTVKAGMPVETGRDEAFAVTMTVMLRPDDLVAIGNLMRAEEATISATEVGDVCKRFSVPASAIGDSLSSRKVVHVDVPDADDKVRFVWLDYDNTTEAQRMFAVGIDGTNKQMRYAIPVDQLTAHQMQGAKIETL